MLSELHSLNLKSCSKQYNKKNLHLIVAPQLSSGWQHNYSTKTRKAGWANEQSMYSLMSMRQIHGNKPGKQKIHLYYSKWTSLMCPDIGHVNNGFITHAISWHDFALS